jgi:hypothetical protein
MNPIDAYGLALAPIAAAAVARGERAYFAEAAIDLLLELLPEQDKARPAAETLARGFRRMGVPITPG